MAAALIGEWKEADLEAKRASVVSGIQSYRDAVHQIIALDRPQGAISPAFRWAQNSSRLMIEVKFSHTLSAPAKIDVSLGTVSIEARTVRVSAASPGQRWELVLGPLWGEVDTTTASHSDISAGRFSISMNKAVSSVRRWPRLVGCNSQTPPNSALWLDMQEALGSKGADDSDELEDVPCRDLDSMPAVDDSSIHREERVRQTETNKAEKSTLDKKQRAKMKALKKRADAAHRVVKDDLARKKKEVEAHARAASLRVREEHDARMLFLDAPPDWAWSLPKRFVVRDGMWDIFVTVARARKRGSNSPQCVLLLFFKRQSIPDVLCIARYSRLTKGLWRSFAVASANLCLALALSTRMNRSGARLRCALSMYILLAGFGFVVPFYLYALIQ